MSAFVSVVYPDSIRLLTDGAIYTDKGVLIDVRRKVWTSEGLPVAVTGRGSSEAITVIAGAITMMADLMPVKSVDDMLVGLETFFAGMGERGFPEGQMGEYLIVAWSETRGPVQYYVTSVTAPGYNEGVQPFQLTRITSPFLVAGAADEATFVADLAFIGLTADTLSGSDAMRQYGADILEVMRRRPGPNPIAPEQPHMFGIGGQADLTTIAPDGVKVETLRRWPDRIGEKITPARLHSEVAKKIQRKEPACA